MKKIVGLVDSFLNSITMYRLVLYGLVFLALESILFSLFGILSFNAISLVGSFFVLFVTCFITNMIWAKVLHVSVNVESATITAFILFFLFSPAGKLVDLPVLLLAGLISMSSKYVLAIQKKHLFNPAALAAFALGLTSFGGASWWAGSAVLVPTTFVIGMLIVRKIRRFHLFFAFLFPAIVAALGMGYLTGLQLSEVGRQIITSWPTLFFGTIMLTEPLTTPPTIYLRMAYGALVGILFGSQFHIGPIYSTPELALLIGNVFSFIVSPKMKQVLTLKQKNKLSPDLYEFVFSPERHFSFTPGQYVEWTLGHAHPDSRGNRRYFTIASSPTEEDIRLGVKFYPESSSFKKKLLSLNSGDRVGIDQLAGDFTLPNDMSKKIVFIAGGIGITPFRSMIQYLIDTKQKRDAVLFFANKGKDDVIYKDVFDTAFQTLGFKTIYTLSDESLVPPNWKGYVGRIDMNMVKKEVPDYLERTFYLSGPHAMVTAYAEVLYSLGIKSEQIKIDFFPGFA